MPVLSRVLSVFLLSFFLTACGGADEAEQALSDVQNSTEQNSTEQNSTEQNSTEQNSTEGEDKETGQEDQGESGKGPSSDGEAGDTERSLSELTSRYKDLSDKRYQGSSLLAEMNEQSLLRIAGYLFGEMSYKPNSKVGSVTLTASHSKDNFIRTRSDEGAAETEVSEACAISGMVRSKGQRNSDGVGTLVYQYEQCRTKDVTLNGSITRHFYDSSDRQMVFYDNLSILQTGQTSPVVYSGMFGEELYLTVYDKADNSYLKVMGLRKAETEWFIDGSLCFSFAGCVSMSVDMTPATEFEESLFGSRTGNIYLAAAQSRGEIGLFENGYTFKYGDSLSGGYSRATFLIGKESFTRNSYQNLSLVSIDALNYPPQVFTPSVVTVGAGDTLSTFTVVEGNDPYDREQNTVSIVEYQWFVNGIKKFTTQNKVLPSNSVFSGERVAAAILYSDGVNQVLSGLSSEYSVADAAPKFEWKQVPSVVTAGEQVNFTLRFTDADSPGSYTVPNIDIPPPGWGMDAEGLVSWTPVSPSHGGRGKVTVHMTHNGVSQNLQFLVQDNSDDGYVTLTSQAISQKAVDAGNYNGVGVPDLLVWDSTLRLFEQHAGSYRVMWEYPYAFPAVIEQVVGTDFDADERHEIFVLAGNQIYLIPDLVSMARSLPLFDVSTHTKLISFIVEDVNGDNVKEGLVLCKNCRASNSGTELLVFNLQTNSLLSATNVSAQANRMAVGRLDNKDGKEIALNDGHILDAVTLAEKWYFPQGFGSSMVIGDLIGNGRDLIVGLNDNIEVFDVQQQAKIKELVLRDGESVPFLNVINLDANAGAELIFSSFYAAPHFYVYGFDGNAFSLQWVSNELPASKSTFTKVKAPNSVVIANTDSDNQMELHWNYYSKPGVTVPFYVGEVYSNQDAIAQYQQGFQYFLSDDHIFPAGWENDQLVFTRGTINPDYSSQYSTMSIEYLDSDFNIMKASYYPTDKFQYVGQSLIVRSDTQTDTQLAISTDQLGVGRYDVAQDKFLWQEIFYTQSVDGPRLWAGDVNGDKKDEIVHSHDGIFKVQDPVNGTLVTLSLGVINDVIVADINKDGFDDILVAYKENLSPAKVTMWAGSASGLSNPRHYGLTCQRLELVDTDRTELSLVCSEKVENKSNLRIYSLPVDAEAVLLASHTLDALLTDVVATPNRRNLFMVVPNQAENTLSSYIEERSATDFALLWQSPDFVGGILKDSLRLSVGNSKVKMAFISDKAVYQMQ